MIWQFFLLGCFSIVACQDTLVGEPVHELAEFDLEDSEIVFVRRIAPLIRKKCLGCHGNDPDLIEGSLDLRERTGLLTGGDSGEPSVVPGRPLASSFYLAAKRDHDDWSPMPPKEAEQLTAEQLEWVRQWISDGAAWPNENRRIEIEKKFSDEWSAEDGVVVETAGGLSPEWNHRKYHPEGLWAYRPVKKPKIETGDRNPIDLLIEDSVPPGLKLAPRADRRTLIRRATFDLTGLPPKPQQVAKFVNDPRGDRVAFGDLVDDLLASKHYGERMAQHWLDVVRYADSSGFANDFERGNAWRYRDYVVRSFNADKPFDQFIREQIAGDEMAAMSVSKNDVVESDPESIIATGFLRMGPWELTGMEVAKVARQRFLDDVTNSVGETFLAHSLQCARCHDHKFDPIPTKDYYSLQAVFATTQLAERAVPFLPEERKDGFEERQYLAKRMAEYQQTLAELEQVLLSNAIQWHEENGLSPDTWNEAVENARSKGSPWVFHAARNAMARKQIPEDQYPPKLVGFTPQQFGRERVARKGIQRLKWELDRYRPYALAVYNGRTRKFNKVVEPVRIPKNRAQGELEQTCILTGGDPFSPAEEVTPGALSVLDPYVAADIPEAIAGRRTALADWIADADNPLTARVIANRIWLWHFGQAIAGNPNNFGSTGKRPTHPRLLDWLAAIFVEDGWSIKNLHRRVMNSDAYCRTALHPDPDVLAEKDPLKVSYAVFQPRRLSAEELRDAMLQMTGELNAKVGGIPCRPEINPEVALQPRQVMGTFAAAWTPNPKPSERHRRSIYVLKLRGLMDPMLEVFNTPSPDFSCERRESSTVTPQVFTLFNGRNTHSRALALSHRVLHQTDTDEEAVQQIFRLVFSREPNNAELKELLDHWKLIEQQLPDTVEPATGPPLKVVREAVEENTGEKFTFEEELYSNREFIPDLQPDEVDRQTRALADICLVLLNANEFVYVY